MSNTRITVTFSNPNWDYLHKEAQILGISIASLLGRIVDDHRARLGFSLQRHNKSIQLIRNCMDESGRYIDPAKERLWYDMMLIYRKVKNGDKVSKIAEFHNLSEGRIRKIYQDITGILEKEESFNRDPEIIENSPLPVRVLGVLRHKGITKFSQLDGFRRQELVGIQNFGSKSANILEAFLEFKFPQYKLT